MLRKSKIKLRPLGFLLGLVILLVLLVFWKFHEEQNNLENQPVQSSGSIITEYPTAIGIQGTGWEVWFTKPDDVTIMSDTIPHLSSVIGDFIGSATKSISMAAFELDDPTISNALIQAKEEGISISVVTDDEYGMKDEHSLLPHLQAQGIAIRDDNKSSLMHNKFIVVDATDLLVGSTKFYLIGAYKK